MQKKWAYLVVCIGIMLLYSGCTTNHSPNDTTGKIPEKGEQALPILAPSDYSGMFIKSTDDRRLKRNHMVNLNNLEPLLEAAREQTNSNYVAVYSLKDSTGSWYTYHVQELFF